MPPLRPHLAHRRRPIRRREKQHHPPRAVPRVWKHPRRKRKRPETLDRFDVGTHAPALSQRESKHGAVLGKHHVGIRVQSGYGRDAGVGTGRRTRPGGGGEVVGRGSMGSEESPHGGRSRGREGRQRRSGNGTARGICGRCAGRGRGGGTGEKGGRDTQHDQRPSLATQFANRRGERRIGASGSVVPTATRGGAGRSLVCGICAHHPRGPRPISPVAVAISKHARSRHGRHVPRNARVSFRCHPRRQHLGTVLRELPGGIGECASPAETVPRWPLRSQRAPPRVFTPSRCRQWTQRF
mmetsp:Transcript_17500/g.36917  ORF Transcript_17500/g.36917 Transcript_17500/m.36917 type:complete len:297 (+) Transcript_17500:927-1817(+)